MSCLLPVCGCVLVMVMRCSALCSRQHPTEGCALCYTSGRASTNKQIESAAVTNPETTRRKATLSLVPAPLQNVHFTRSRLTQQAAGLAPVVFPAPQPDLQLPQPPHLQTCWQSGDAAYQLYTALAKPGLLRFHTPELKVLE